MANRRERGLRGKRFFSKSDVEIQSSLIIYIFSGVLHLLDILELCLPHIYTSTFQQLKCIMLVSFICLHINCFNILHHQSYVCHFPSVSTTCKEGISVWLQTAARAALESLYQVNGCRQWQRLASWEEQQCISNTDSNQMVQLDRCRVTCVTVVEKHGFTLMILNFNLLLLKKMT